MGALLEGLIKHDLAAITVDELCSRIGVSKVTFFKHFIHKEQVLDYFVCRWQYRHSAKLESGKLAGAAGIRDLFDSIAADPLGLRVMVALVSYYSRLEEPPEMPEISPCEYWHFDQDAFERDVRPRDLGEILDYYLKQVDVLGKTGRRQALNALVALLYGVPIQFHIMGRPREELRQAYRRGVAAILE